MTHMNGRSNKIKRIQNYLGEQVYLKYQSPNEITLKSFEIELRINQPKCDVNKKRNQSIRTMELYFENLMKPSIFCDKTIF